MKKVTRFFPLKGKNIYLSCKIYQGDYNSYIDEKHVGVNIIIESTIQNQCIISNWFNSFIIADASNYKWTWKNSKVNYFALKRRKLNDQYKYHKLVLFRNGIYTVFFLFLSNNLSFTLYRYLFKVWKDVYSWHFYWFWSKHFRRNKEFFFNFRRIWLKMNIFYPILN